MATEVVKVVDPDNGQGTDYTSLSAWEAGEQRNLVTADEIAVAKCRCTNGTADTAQVIIDGWTTDSTRYIKIWTDPSEGYRHEGKYQTGNKYRLTVNPSSTDGAPIQVYTGANHCRFIGLQIVNTRTNVNDDAGVVKLYYASGTSGWVYITHSILKFASTGASMGYRSALRCEMFQSTSMTLYVGNSLIYDVIGGTTVYTQGLHLQNIASAYVYNCTIHNCQKGITREGGNVYVKNCILKDCVDCLNGTFYFVDYCSTDDANFGSSYSIQNGNTSNRFNQTFSFVNEGDDDFHLTSSDTGAKDYGTNLSSDSDFPFSDDIDGQTRSGTWDIGADEHVSGQVNQHSFRFRNDDGDEDEATWKANLNTNINLSAGNIARLRILLDATDNPDPMKYRLEYRRKPSGGSWGGWEEVT